MTHYFEEIPMCRTLTAVRWIYNLDLMGCGYINEGSMSRVLGWIMDIDQIGDLKLSTAFQDAKRYILATQRTMPSHAGNTVEAARSV